MDKTLFELVPVSVKPEKDGWYWVQHELNNKYFRYSAKYENGAWWDYLDDGEGLLQVYAITHYLRPSLPPPVAEERTEVSQFLHDIAHDFDCDQDAHKYGTMCRACQARKLISQFNITLPE